MAHLLVIDDDAGVREVIRLYLDGSGHRVIEAKDGYAGIKAFAQASFDLVITDIFMPDQDGIETIRMLRKLRPTIKIIAISGGIVGDKIYLREAKSLGADSCIAKTIPPNGLAQSRQRVPRWGDLPAMMMSRSSWKSPRRPLRARFRDSNRSRERMPGVSRTPSCVQESAPMQHKASAQTDV